MGGKHYKPTPGDERLNVRKYPNRRLYDLERGTYCTQEDVLSAIRAGREVRVLMHESEEDVTAEIILQAIQGDAALRNRLFTSAGLHALIRRVA